MHRRSLGHEPSEILLLHSAVCNPTFIVGLLCTEILFRPKENEMSLVYFLPQCMSARGVQLALVGVLRCDRGYSDLHEHNEVPNCHCGFEATTPGKVYALTHKRQQ